MSFTQFLSKSLLKHLANRGAYTAPIKLYAGLTSVTPTETGTFVDAVGTGYSRVTTISTDWTDGTDADPSVMDNATPITFPAATGDWDTGSNMTHFGIFDALTAGNLLAFGTLTTAKPVLSGDTAEFAIGDLDITLD